MSEPKRRNAVLETLDLREPNYRWAMINGWFAILGDSFFNGSIVLASFAAKLGVANWAIGLMPALIGAGSMVPQAFVAPYVARLPVKMVLYRRMAVARVGSLALIALAAFTLGGYPELLLWCFVGGLALNGLMSSWSSLAWWESVAKTVPLERRVALFSGRNLVGGVLAFGAGFLVRYILSLPIPFPVNYGIIFTLGCIAFGYGWYVFGNVNEPPDSGGQGERISFSKPFRDFYFRRFLRVRVLMAVGAMVEPFYAAYAVRVLKQSSEIGLYLTLYALSAVLSNLVWVQLSKRYGSKSLILAGAALGMLNPALALLLPHQLFGVVFVMQGAYLAAIGVGTATYLLNLAPTDQRSSYIGLANTIVGLLAFSPVLGGLLADIPTIGYLGPMVLATLCYGWSFYAGRKLKQLDKDSLFKNRPGS